MEAKHSFKLDRECQEHLHKRLEWTFTLSTMALFHPRWDCVSFPTLLPRIITTIVMPHHY